MNKLMEIIQGLPVMAMVLSFVVAFNVMLAGVSKALDMIKDKTKTDLDNKLAVVIHKVANTLQKILDFAGFNPPHA